MRELQKVDAMSREAPLIAWPSRDGSRVPFDVFTPALEGFGITGGAGYTKTKIIDFNVSVRADDKESRGGGSRRYLPPDFDPEVIPYNGERADRDLYALGLTLYQALTARYPWDTTEPPINKPAPDPRDPAAHFGGGAGGAARA